jgi:hypothetical protein
LIYRRKLTGFLLPKQVFCYHPTTSFSPLAIFTDSQPNFYEIIRKYMLMSASPILLILLLAGFSLFAQPDTDVRNRDLVFRNVTVIPMDEERVLENRVVIIRDGRIHSIGDASTPHRPDALVVDGTGKFLMPGLAEMHAHIPPIEDMEPMKRVLMLFAVNGITTIRGMLGHPRHLELRDML